MFGRLQDAKCWDRVFRYMLGLLTCGCCGFQVKIRVYI